MTNLGMGVMIGRLGGNKRSVEAWQKGVNKKITKLYMKDDSLIFEFDDGYIMRIADEGQSCCEHRYIMTDDELPDFVGSKLIDAEIKEGPNLEHEWGEHETEFLIITTNMGQFTMVTHNEHNGYYGGFWIQASEIEKPVEAG